MFAGNAGLWAGRGVIGPITCGWELDLWVSWEKPFFTSRWSPRGMLWYSPGLIGAITGVPSIDNVTPVDTMTPRNITLRHLRTVQ